MAGPVGDAGAGIGVEPGVRGVPHDLDPKLAVREVTIVESEGEIGIGRGRAGTARKLRRVHHRSQIEQIRIQIPHHLKPNQRTPPFNYQLRRREEREESSESPHAALLID